MKNVIMSSEIENGEVLGPARETALSRVRDEG